MNFKPVIALVLFLVIIFFVLFACGTDEATPKPVVEPVSAAASPTVVVQNVAPEPPPEITARTLVNLNLRQGPGTHYPVTGSLPAGTEVVVIGRLKDGSWLQIKTEAGEGWISGQADFVTVEASLLAGIPVVEAPAPAYDASNPMVHRVLNEIPLVVHHGGSYTCASHGGLQHLLPEVRSGNVVGPHAGDFVYGSDNVLFEYSSGGFQLIRENPVARFEDGAKYLSLAQAMQLFAEGKIVWTGTAGQWPGRGVPGCDPVAKS
jgi:hypothetical protein